MPGHVGQNDTDFTLLQEELNAPIIRPLRQLDPYNWVNFGGPLPLNGGGSGGKRWGTIDLIEVYWPALTRIGCPSKLGSY